METNQIMMLGLGLQAPWKLVSQHLDIEVSPHQLQLEVAADRGGKYPCPCCQTMCNAHDFKEKTWRHLNFFQHHCYISAKVPRVSCPQHGIKQVEVPWARPGSGFTLLFEQVALMLSKEMPVNAAARMMEITDQRLWRVLRHYVGVALAQVDTSSLKAIGMDETASKRGHKYVTVFIDMEKAKEPVLFATSGKGKETVNEFRTFMKAHQGKVENVTEVVCDMSPAFLSGIDEHFPAAQITVDWFHIVQHFVKAVDETRKLEHRHIAQPKGARFALLKGPNKPLTATQLNALNEILERDSETAKAWKIKESLRWIRASESLEQARGRIDEFVRRASILLQESVFMEPVRKALNMLKKHADKVIQRWSSTYTNARLEGLNSLFQAARARARGYRNNATFILMIYMIGSPVASILKST